MKLSGGEMWEREGREERVKFKQRGAGACVEVRKAKQLFAQRHIGACCKCRFLAGV